MLVRITQQQELHFQFDFIWFAHYSFGYYPINSLKNRRYNVAVIIVHMSKKNPYNCCHSTFVYYLADYSFFLFIGFAMAIANSMWIHLLSNSMLECYFYGSMKSSSILVQYIDQTWTQLNLMNISDIKRTDKATDSRLEKYPFCKTTPPTNKTCVSPYMPSSV